MSSRCDADRGTVFATQFEEVGWTPDLLQFASQLTGCRTQTKEQGETQMSEQQSTKRGLQSSGQKEDRAREPYERVPPSNAKPGAFGNKSEDESDQDLGLKQSTMKKKKNQSE